MQSQFMNGPVNMVNQPLGQSVGKGLTSGQQNAMGNMSQNILSQGNSSQPVPPTSNYHSGDISGPPSSNYQQSLHAPSVSGGALRASPTPQIGTGANVTSVGQSVSQSSTSATSLSNGPSFTQSGSQTYIQSGMYCLRATFNHI